MVQSFFSFFHFFLSHFSQRFVQRPMKLNSIGRIFLQTRSRRVSGGRLASRRAVPVAKHARFDLASERAVKLAEPPGTSPDFRVVSSDRTCSVLAAGPRATDRGQKVTPARTCLRARGTDAPAGYLRPSGRRVPEVAAARAARN